jgi:hypothetical protein
MINGINYLMNKKKSPDELQGEWLLFFNDEIIDHSSNIKKILKLAEKKFPEDRFPEDTIKISKVLSGDIRLR